MLAQRFGLIAGAAASAVIVAWLAFADGPAKTIHAEVDASATKASSARAELAEGKRLYRARDYRAAAEILGRATTHVQELTQLERQDLNNYLRRAKAAAERQAKIAALPADAAADRKSPAQSGFTPAGETAREKAKSLLAESHRRLEAGDIDAAWALAERAASLDVKWGFFDERPHHLKAEIERKSAQTPTIRGQSEDGAATAAQSLLREARQAIAAGDYKTAEAKIAEAEKLEVVYGVFDDRPELVRQDMAHVRQAKPTQTETATPVASDDASADAKAQATQLVAQGRAALKAGDVKTALAKAKAAEALGVEFSAFEDRPDMIRSDAARLTQTAAPASNTQADPANPFSANATSPVSSPVEKSSTETPADPAQAETNPFSAMAASESETQAATAEPAVEPKAVPKADPSVKTADVAEPEGSSAVELYEFAMQRLREGDTAGAYAAFLEVHQSGGKLDGYRQQQLQNYLRELAPAEQGVKQASSTGPAMTGDASAVDEALTAATEAEKVEFDKLRTEVLNAIFRAERLRETKPDAAIKVLDRTLEAIAASNLPKRHLERLSRQLENSKESIASYAEMMAPKIALEERNANVKESIERDLAAEAEKETEMKRLVDKYNELVDQRRYAEAEEVARQAKELDPENPVAVTMLYKAKVLFQKARNEKIDAGKAEYFTNALAAVDMAATGMAGDIEYAENWEELSEGRLAKYGENGLVESEREKEIRESLDRPISLHFENVPLSQVVADISEKTNFNVVIDHVALKDGGITSDTPITIDVDGIMVKSALNLVLEPLGLGYVVENEVLNITSHAKQQGELVTKPYPVADLVIPIPNFGPGFQGGGANYFGAPLGSSGFGGSGMPGAPQMSIPSMGGSAFGQVLDPANPIGTTGIPRTRTSGGARGMEFEALSTLISTTVAPGSWGIMGGPGVMTPSAQTLSLVVRQTQQVHEEIEDLLTQLRNLQDIQVTVEVRFINVSDNFAEFIGVDFDFNVQDTFGGPVGPGFGEELNPGEVGDGQVPDPVGGDPNFFEQPNPDRDLRNYDSYRDGSVIGVTEGGTIPGNLDIPFRQGSFDLARPTLDGNQVNGATIGFAVLSDIEAFFFIEAVQQDQRSNILSAPKITLFNGQTAFIADVINRPFVISLRPVVGIGSIGFEPQIQVIPDGVQLSVQAVVSADRRYVRLSLAPQFTTIIDVEQFTYSTGANVGGNGVIGVGGGGGVGGVGGGVGGVGGGVGGGVLGGGGIGGGRVARNALLAALPAQQDGGQGGEGGQGGQGGEGGQGGQDGQDGQVNLGQTVQQPVLSNTQISTTVSVPDGGTILMGGVKRLTERRNMQGVPILNKIPYISRLFKNSGVARETSSLMMMVTPRIIIADEEEELLATPL